MCGGASSAPVPAAAAGVGVSLVKLSRARTVPCNQSSGSPRGPRFRSSQTHVWTSDCIPTLTRANWGGGAGRGAQRMSHALAELKGDDWSASDSCLRVFEGHSVKREQLSLWRSRGLAAHCCNWLRG